MVYEMTFLAKKLKRRIQILQAIDSENEFGGFTRSYDLITTIWCSVKPLSEYIQAIRGTNQNEKITHEFLVRLSAINILGKEFGKGFSTDFGSIADSNPVKSDYYLMLEEGSNIKGNLFRIRGTSKDEMNREFLKITAEMIEEKGTGYPETNIEAF